MSGLSYKNKITGQECTIGTGNLVDDLIVKLRSFGITDLPNVGTTNISDVEALAGKLFIYFRDRYPNTPFVQELIASGRQAMTDRTIASINRAATNGAIGMLIVAYGNIPQHLSRVDGGFTVTPDNSNDALERIPRVCTDASLEDNSTPILVAAAVGVLVYLATK